MDKLKVKDLTAKSNPQFFEFLQQILDLNTARLLGLGTFLINLYIAQNYFSSANFIYNQMPESFKETLPPDKFREFRVYLEKIYTIFILMNLKFRKEGKLSSERTDEIIDRLQSNKTLVRSFFTFNTLPRGLTLSELKKYYQKYFIPDHLFPNLIFDPLFGKVIRSEPVKHIFFTTRAQNLLNFSQKQEKFRYYPQNSQFLKISYLTKNRGNKLFKIDSSLKISKFDKEFLNYIGVFDFGSHSLIDDLFSTLTNYYIIRIPSKKEEIINFFPCFAQLLKVCDGKLYRKLRFSKFMRYMMRTIPKSTLSSFLRVVCCIDKNKQFDPNFNNFKPKRFLQEYHQFLSYGCFKHAGIIYSGVYLVWRSLIKYLEDLQQDLEFKLEKGKMLENWCYRKAVKYGFSAEKIILTNSLTNPTPGYWDMKEQVKNFPRDPLEIKVNFFEGDPSYFREIDLAFKVQNCLFMFECKGTSAPIGEEGRIYSWGSHFEKNTNVLSEKSNIISFNLQDGTITHPFFENVEKTVLEVIKTEGLLGKYGIMFPQEFEQYLKDLRHAIDNNNFKEFFEEEFRDLNENKLELNE